MLGMAMMTVLAVASSAHASARNPVFSRPCIHHFVDGGSIYDYEIEDIHGTENVSLSNYSGKVVLIVNVATYCGYTEQYLDMNALQVAYANFTVLGFPCNQFGKQEPGANGTEILNGIKHVRPGNGFEPSFPIFKKIDVNGETEHPLFSYLKSYCPPTRSYFSHPDKLFYDQISNSDIRWNWEKFLITKRGKPYARYDASTKPNAIKQDIEFLLQQMV